MMIYRAHLDNTPWGSGTSHYTWLVRGKTFEEVARNASASAERIAKEFTAEMFIVSLEYLGKEE